MANDPLDEQSLKALISQEISASITYTSTELTEKRTRAIEYYEGTMNDTPSAPGRSSVVSRDVADTIGWMLPGIIRVFTASDRMAEFEPVGKGDDRFARQATDYCNHIFWKDNPGYRILWDATHDSLLQGNGIVKHWWDASEDCEYSQHTGLTAEQVALIEQDGGEVVAQTPGEPQKIMVPDPQTGQMQEQEIPTFTVKIKRVTRSGMVRIECIEPESFMMDADAKSIEEARFCAHREEKTRSELIEMGFDQEVVDNLPAYSKSGLQSEALARDPQYDAQGFTGHHAMQPIELYECYVRADVDGDGIAETVRAYYAGNSGNGEILNWDVWDDDIPFSDIPCTPVPHRWDADSIADETTDMQRVRTVLTRQFLDNLYWVNNPLQYAEEGSIANPEMMRAPVFGGTVFTKPGKLPPQPLAIPFIGDKALMGLEHFSQVIEKRTGVSRSTMALDPETLQNQSATANQNQKDASYSQVELIARNQAELGWKRVFAMILRLVVKHQDRPRVIRLKDEPVEMDPRFWNTSMDVNINVGLGTGSRDRDMAMLGNILQTQTNMSMTLAQGGYADKAIDMIPKIIKTAIKLAESAGIRNPDDYYPNITDQDVAQMKQQAQQPKPDPKVELEKQKLQFEQQKAQNDAQLERERMQNAAQLEREKMQAETQVKREQLQAEMQLKREQLAAEMQLKMEVTSAELAMKRDVGMYNADTRAATSSVRLGGQPG